MSNPDATPLPPGPPTPPKRSRFARSFRWLRWAIFAGACLITLLVVFITIQNWRGKRAWDAYKVEQLKSGFKFDFDTYVPPPVPDSENFAMTPFLAPLFEFNPRPLQPGQTQWRDTNGYNRARNFASNLVSAADPGRRWPGKRMSDQEIWLAALTTNSSDSPFASPKEAATELLKNFEQYQSVLDELRTASHRPYARFNIEYDREDRISILLPHLNVLRTASRVLDLRTRAELILGKSDAAFDDLTLILALADSVKHEPFLVSYLVRLAILNSALLDLGDGINRHAWSAQQLQQLQGRLGKLSVLAEASECMDAERVGLGNSTFDLLRRRPEYFSAIAENSDPKRASPFHLFPSGWLYFEQINYNRLFIEESTRGIDSVAGRVTPAIVEDERQVISNSLEHDVLAMVFEHRLFARILLPSLANFIRKSAAGQVDVDEAATACALERYRLSEGAYPENLDALVPRFMTAIPHDVINGNPLKYRRTDQGGFVLYSVGWNETDDGGVPTKRETTSQGSKTETGDWVWPISP